MKINLADPQNFRRFVVIGGIVLVVLFVIFTVTAGLRQANVQQSPSTQPVVKGNSILNKGAGNSYSVEVGNENEANPELIRQKFNLPADAKIEIILDGAGMERINPGDPVRPPAQPYPDSED